MRLCNKILCSVITIILSYDAAVIINRKDMWCHIRSFLIPEFYKRIIVVLTWNVAEWIMCTMCVISRGQLTSQTKIQLTTHSRQMATIVIWSYFHSEKSPLFRYLVPHRWSGCGSEEGSVCPTARDCIAALPWPIICMCEGNGCDLPYMVTGVQETLNLMPKIKPQFPE